MKIIMTHQRILRYGFCLSPYIASYIWLFIFHNARVALLWYRWLLLIYYLITYHIHPLKKTHQPQKIDKTQTLLVICVSLISYIGIYYWGEYFILDTLKNTNILSQLWINDVILFVIAFISINAMSEEYFWRILYNHSFWKNQKSLITINDILFAWYHILVLSLFLKPWLLPLVFIGIVVASISRRLHYERYRNTAFLFISHSMIDLAIIIGSMSLLVP